VIKAALAGDQSLVFETLYGLANAEFHGCVLSRNGSRFAQLERRVARKMGLGMIYR
jgi:hypothetical protein